MKTYTFNAQELTQLLRLAACKSEDVRLTGGGAGWDSRTVCAFQVKGHPITLRGDAADAFLELSFFEPIHNQ